jgi:hypothetical protein
MGLTLVMGTAFAIEQLDPDGEQQGCALGTGVGKVLLGQVGEQDASHGLQYGGQVEGLRFTSR